MAKYKLIYFDIPARAEVARILFHYAGEKFEDKRVTQEEWAKMKPGEHAPCTSVDTILYGRIGSTPPLLHP